MGIGVDSKPGIFALAAVALALVLSGARQARAEEVRNPRLQHSLQMLESARGHLDAVMNRHSREMRDEAERTAREVDAAAHDLTEALAAMGTRRSVEPGRAEPTERPARAAREALRTAIDELTHGVSESDMRGRIRAAYDHERAALDRADALAHREETMVPVAPPPPPVVEIRHPRLQRTIQLLELARAQLDAARERLPRDLRFDAEQAARDVDAAGHEAADALADAGVRRTIEPARVEPTDHPARAARDALRTAREELAAITGEEYHGHLRRTTERVRLALDDVESIVRREEGGHR